MISKSCFVIRLEMFCDERHEDAKDTKITTLAIFKQKLNFSFLLLLEIFYLFSQEVGIPTTFHSTYVLLDLIFLDIEVIRFSFRRSTANAAGKRRTILIKSFSMGCHFLHHLVNFGLTRLFFGDGNLSLNSGSCLPILHGESATVLSGL